MGGVVGRQGGRRYFCQSFAHRPDRKSTRLNSSHSQISYAVFCLKKNSYDYDLAGNRTVEVMDTSVNGETPNNLNQLTARQGVTGMMPIRGTTNDFAWVFVNVSYA